MGKPLRVLMVEDSEDDVLLTVRVLKKGGYDPVYERVEDAGAMRKALEKGPWDIILCDYQMPQFNGLAAISLLKETAIDIPLIMVSGAIGEETAVECMRFGAHDYVMKNKMSRLVPAIERELKEVETGLQRKQAEEALKESEEKYRNILESMNDSYFETDLRGNMTFCNPMVPKSLGYSPEEMAGMNHRVYMDPENAEIVERNFRDIYRENIPSKVISYEVIRKDRTKAHIETSLSLIKNKDGHSIGYRGISRDSTDRKLAEEALRESEELLRSYLENAPDGIYMNDLESNFLYGNRKCEEITGYRHEELIGKNFLELNLLSENSLDKAIQLLQANMEGKSTGPDEIDLINKEGRLIPVEINTNVVQRLGQRIVIASVRDITERKKAEQNLKETLERLRKAVGTTIQVMVSAVETRDPYTAGHQIRSADLARAIATEMGLSQDRIDGIRMAGSIHDIGKLSIPAEILVKPTKLTEIEFSLIKEHSRRGYEILKDVESPWSLAEIVYQHHERMDGSGYPRNLKGDEILMEARIMAVADVVESMASHRPYRPALGIDVALEEIEKNRGTFYDNAVADACLRLFREKGFQLERP
jgi:PAS domain S-box-containing protein